MTGLKGWKLWTLIAIFVACAAVPLVVQNNYVMQILFRIAIFAAMGLAWNVVGGYAGQLSLGHVAFFGLGAYAFTLFTDAGVPMWISLFLAAAVASMFSAVIGWIVFRLRGPYFTLATIAAAEVLRLVSTNLKITNGAIGLDTPALFSGAMRAKSFYLAALVLALVTLLVNVWVSGSRFGY